MHRSSHRRRRPGFTLVELLVVIIIIGVLIALLLPAISSAVVSVRNAGVTTEMQNIGQGMTAFRNQYGEYPPSRIMLMENGAFDTTGGTTTATWFGTTQPLISPTDITYAQLAQRSLKYLRKFFPRAVFSSDATSPLASGTYYDFNGNGTQDAHPIYLEGHEALVFFLGGIPDPEGGVISPSGFTMNPQKPFDSIKFLGTAQSNRQEPFYQFNTSRLIDDDGDGMPGYVDTLATGPDARFYAYFSSYGGGSYDPNDANFVELNDSNTGEIARTFQVTFSVGGSNLVGSYAPNPYTSDQSQDSSGNPLAPRVYFNPDSYQIVSSGRDRLFGVGGTYVPNSTSDPLPIPDVTSSYQPTVNHLDSGIRQRERDNLTNFASAKLD